MDLLVLGRIESRIGELERIAKAVPLVIYLTEQGPCARDAIARMFWPQATQPHAALSTTLWRIRQLAPQAIEADQRWLQSAVDTDVGAFRAAVNAGAQHQAAALYGGDLLPGVERLDVGPEIRDWLLEQRHFLARLAQECAAALAPTDPNVALDLRGRAHLDAPPDGEARQDTPQPTEPIRRTSRRAPRAEELTALVKMCRPGVVINLTGPPGVGKSFLLAEFERSLGPGAHYAKVDLDGPGVGISDDFDEPLALGSQIRWLLVDHAKSDSPIDDFVDLARQHRAGAVIVSRLPLRAPRVSTFRLTGLSTDHNAESGFDDPSPAARLLAEVAARHGAPEANQAEDRADLERLAVVTGGLPQAIELFGAWLSLYRPGELADIDNNHDAYVLVAPGFDESIQNYADQLIDIDKVASATVARLSVFANEFDLRAAQIVADVDASDILRLRDLGLLTNTRSGAFALPILARFAGQARLHADAVERHSTEVAFVRCVSGWLGRTDRATANANEEVAQQLERHIPDYARAMDLLISQGRWDDATDLIETLARVLLNQGRAADLRAITESVVHGDQTGNANAKHRRLAHRAAAHLATALCFFDEHRTTLAFCDEIIERLDDDEFDSAAILYRAKSLISGDMGRFDDLLAAQRLAHRAAHAGTNERMKLLTRWDLSVSCTGLGRLDESDELLRDCIASSRDLGDQLIEAHCYLQLARNRIATDPLQSLVYIEEARDEIRSTGNYYQLLYLEGEARRHAGEPHTAKRLYLEAQVSARDLGLVLFDSAVTVRLATVEMSMGHADVIGDLLAHGLNGLAQMSGWPDVLQTMAETAQIVLESEPADELARAAYDFAISDSRFPGELRPAYESRLSLFGDPAAEIGTDGRIDTACEVVLRLQRHLATGAN